jgi:NAD(P)-dependent dehydrogenase (short-subunit alcohol dehydrogenase family)
MDVHDRCVVVTGGASGLGLAVTEALVVAGARVLVADVNRVQGEAVADRLGPAVRFQCSDVADAGSVAAAVQAAQAHAVHCAQGLGGLVQCAGVAVGRKVLGVDGLHPPELFARTLAVNLTGVFLMLACMAQALAAQAPDPQGQRGVIVNTASIAAFDGQVGQAAYAASKGGVVAMTLPLARELAAQGIRVMTVAPGLMQTPMLAGLPDKVQAALGASVPFPARTGQPQEFAALVLHIFANDYLNGEVIRLDGALRMAPR